MLEYDAKAVKKDRNIFILILFFESGEFVGETLISGNLLVAQGHNFAWIKAALLVSYM